MGTDESASPGVRRGSRGGSFCRRTVVSDGGEEASRRRAPKSRSTRCVLLVLS